MDTKVTKNINGFLSNNTNDSSNEKHSSDNSGGGVFSIKDKEIYPVKDGDSVSPRPLPRSIKMSIVDINTADTEDIEVSDYDTLQGVICSELIAPALFTKNHRCQVQVYQADFFFLDIESGISPEAVRADLDAKGLIYVISFTRNHLKEKHTREKVKPAIPRMRVFLMFDRLVTSKAELEQVLQGLERMFPDTDTSTTETARQFLPSVKIYTANYDGKMLQVDYLIKLGQAKVKSAPQKEAITAPVGKKKLSRRTLEFLHYGAENWNDSLFLAACDFRNCEYTKEEAIANFSKMENEHFYKGHLDNTDLRSIDSAFDYPVGTRFAGDTDGPISKSEKQANVTTFDLTRIEQHVMDAILDVTHNMPHYNELKNCIYFGNEKITDHHLALIRTDLAKKEETTRRYKGTDEDSKKYVPLITSDRISDLIVKFAHMNKSHPFKDYVTTSTWDKKADYINELFEKSIVLQDEFEKYKEFYRVAFKKFFVGLIKRVTEKGTDQFCLVFQGATGIGKSRTVDGLMPVMEAYFSGSVDPRNKDHLAYHGEYILGHISELDGVITKALAAALKSFINPKNLTFRRPYDKFSIDIQSQLSFVATTNEVGFLKDPTGNRRFVVFPVKKMNPDHGVDLQQVYAQALTLYSDGFQNWFTPDEEHIRDEINAYFTEELNADVIVTHLEPMTENDSGDGLSLHDIISYALQTKLILTPPSKNELEAVIIKKLKVFKSRPSEKSAFKYRVKFKTYTWYKNTDRSGDKNPANDEKPLETGAHYEK